VLSDIEKFESGWIGLSFAISIQEIDDLVSMLNLLKNGKIGHFHLRACDWSGKEGIADVEFSIKGENDNDNMIVG
jgi:hypothetical protein